MPGLHWNRTKKPLGRFTESGRPWNKQSRMCDLRRWHLELKQAARSEQRETRPGTVLEHQRATGSPPTRISGCCGTSFTIRQSTLSPGKAGTVYFSSNVAAKTQDRTRSFGSFHTLRKLANRANDDRKPRRRLLVIRLVGRSLCHVPIIRLL